MSQRSDVPFNVTLLHLTQQRLASMRPVTSLSSFDGPSTNFHPDGLFSVTIFGRVGSDDRTTRFSFIDIKVPIFHPIIYRALVSLKRLYAGIMAGTEYAIWSGEKNDFEKSDVVNGQTGFNFFVQHWEKIAFTKTNSDSREQNILMIEKYKKDAMTDKVVVMPAGYRDMEIGDDGRAREDEINVLYRKILSFANVITREAVQHSPEVINNARLGLQVQFNSVYELIEAMIEGKKKLLLGKWASRRIFDGTRNVITAMDTSSPVLGSAGSVKFNNTVIGLYQMMKATRPIVRFLLRNGFLSKIFSTVDAPAVLVNKETLRPELVKLPHAEFDLWMTDEGIEKIITSFGEEDERQKYKEIAGRWMGLIYKGPDGTFKLFQDIEELPAGRHREHVTPVTFCELLYSALYMNLNKYPVFVTRYPITGVGSIYPSLAYVKTTIQGEVRTELDDNWEPMSADHTAYEFPVGNKFLNSLVPHSSKLARLGADFDGDTASANVVYSDESIAECHKLLSQKRAYVGTDGRFMSSTNVSTVALVLYNFTG